jgi:hypothetical protein
MAWVDLSGAFGFGTKLTSTQQQNLRDNIAAAFNKDSGAPVLANDYIVNAMIDTGAVNNLEVASGSLRGDRMDTQEINGGFYQLNSGDTQTLPSGVYNITTSDSNVRFQIRYLAVWRSGGPINGMIWSDGSNMRLYKLSGVLGSVYYYKFE